MIKCVLWSTTMLVLLAAVTTQTKNSRELEKPNIGILSFENQQNSDGSYNFQYESEDGSKRFEQGYYKEIDKSEDGKAQVVTGSYSYIDPNGDIVKIIYIADDNGFRPHGNVIHPAIANYLQNLDLDSNREEPDRKV